MTEATERVTDRPLERWTAELPAYQDGLRAAGMNLPICMMMRVMKTTIIMAVRLEATALDSEAPHAEAELVQKANPMELTIQLAVPECEVPRVARVLDEHTRRAIQGVQRTRGTTTGEAVAAALAEADGPGGLRHQLLIHDGGLLREIYGEDRMAEVIRRIVRRKNRLSGSRATRVTDRRGTRLAK